MTSLRVTVCALALLLVLASVLGFAAGDVALQLWNTHPRHAAGHHTDPAHLVWKSTPATLTPSPAAVILGFAGRLTPAVSSVVATGSLRPPFVPPRG
jgi:hypothetical protein